MSMFKRVLAGAVLATLTLIGCADNGSGDKAAVTREGGFPVTIAAANGDVEIESEPERIVSLSPTATEMLFAIDAGPQVVAVDDESDYPADAPVTDLSGFEPNVEAIAAYEPDLVVVASDAGDVIASLEQTGTAVLEMPTAEKLEDTYEQIDQLGDATGHPEEAAELTDHMRAKIEAIVDATPPAEGLTFYHELDPQLFSVTSTTFIGQIYGLLGLENIADAADPAGTGYPQLSGEFVIDADPSFIFLADTQCCGQNAETVAGRAGWDQMQAVTNGRVVELDDDIASRWGPRIVDFLQVVSDEVTAAAGSSAPQSSVPEAGTPEEEAPEEGR
ncbi:MAG: ABC transporter substrate-binding protein [Acidimicrobiia bacterium]|nr:ABC transporter substrate-binding protein [Acidimicrobiia bacterium]